MVTDPDARIPVRTKRIVKKTVLVHGKRVTRRITRWHTTYHWRTGWGNYVFIHHVLPTGESVYSLYAHLAPGSVVVKRGQTVAAGDPVARVGSTGRTTSPHLHLEIRKSVPHDRSNGSELLVEREDEPTAEERSFALLETVNPIDFLQDHVRNFEDLEPGTWQARYAFAACRDGITSVDGDRFHPEASVTPDRLLSRARVCIPPFEPLPGSGLGRLRERFDRRGNFGPGRRERAAARGQDDPFGSLGDPAPLLGSPPRLRKKSWRAERDGSLPRLQPPVCRRGRRERGGASGDRPGGGRDPCAGQGRDPARLAGAPECTRLKQEASREGTPGPAGFSCADPRCRLSVGRALQAGAHSGGIMSSSRHGNAAWLGALLSAPAGCRPGRAVAVARGERAR